MVEDKLPPEPAPSDRSRAALELLHRWLAAPAEPTMDGLLRELTEAFAASGAGLAQLDDGGILTRLTDSGPSPWGKQPELLATIRNSIVAVCLPVETGAWLATGVRASGGLDWILWLEAGKDRPWTPSEAAALTLAGQTLSHRLQVGDNGARWIGQMERLARQRRLEDVAIVTRRLAHDYGNVLTSILGFTELSLAQVPGETPLKRYLGEVHRAVQMGAQFTNRLRLFARRPSPTGTSVRLADVLAAEQARAVAWGPDVHLEVQITPDLPPVGLGAETLLEVLGTLLDNARESLPGPGKVTVVVERATLTATECLDLWGNPSAGEFIRVDVSDTGPGLSSEVRARLFREPFFTNKPRHRGLGLAIAYGVLHSHRGGLILLDRPGGGLTARVYLPIGLSPAGANRTAAAGERAAALDRPAARGSVPASATTPR